MLGRMMTLRTPSAGGRKESGGTDAPPAPAGDAYGTRALPAVPQEAGTAKSPAPAPPLPLLPPASPSVAAADDDAILVRRGAARTGSVCGAAHLTTWADRVSVFFALSGGRGRGVL
jgi:hypothetical protein